MLIVASALGVLMHATLLLAAPAQAVDAASTRQSDPATVSDDGDDDDNGDDDNSHKGKPVLFGAIQKLPANLTDGEWVVGDMTFTVGITTELISRGFVFTEGLIVKVQFMTYPDGTNFARKIEAKFGHNNPCRLQNLQGILTSDVRAPDDNGKRFYGYCPGDEGRAFGLVTARPENTLEGEWEIGDVLYQVTPDTQVVGEEPQLLDRVKVDYVVLGDQSRVATTIRKLNEQGGNPNLSVFVGTVDKKPSAFVGDWVIAGALFKVSEDSIFIERGSLFGSGAHVVIQYEIVNDTRQIIVIVSVVPPGGGDQTVIGQLQSIGGAQAASVASVQQDEEIWVVDGDSYVVSAATQLVGEDAGLAPGSVVLVNSYTENGQRYATMIRAQAGRAYMPMLGR